MHNHDQMMLVALLPLLSEQPLGPAHSSLLASCTATNTHL